MLDKKMDENKSVSDHPSQQSQSKLSAVRPRATRQVAFIVLLIGVLLFTLAASDQKHAATNPNAELPPGPMQQKATTACTECHEARIIVQQRLSKGAWTKEVDKMIKWGAVVDSADHDALVDYLSANFNPDQPPYEPARTADKTGTKKSK